MAVVLSVTPPFPIFFDTNGRPLEDGFIYIGLENLNPLIDANQVAVYSDEALTIPIAQPIRTLAGYPVLSGSPTRLYIGDDNYSIVVTDKNGKLVYSSLSNVTRFGLIDSASIKYVRTQAEITANVIPVTDSYPPINVFRYMTAAQIIDVTTRALTTDVRAALQAAIDVAQVSPGGQVFIPSGAYLIRRVAGLDAQFNGLRIKYTNVFGYTGAGISIAGEGHTTTLYAGDDNMNLIRWSDSNGALDNLSLDSNAKAGVTAIALISSNSTGTATQEHIDWNTLTRLSINNFTEGLVLQTTFTSGGAPLAGGCYYNRFGNLRMYNNTRHIWLKDTAVAKGANRNVFYNCSINGGNTGVWNDGGDTCVFIFCTFEVINTGVLPSAQPTAFYTTNAGTLGLLLTSDNNLLGCIFETCTIDLNCNNRRISILGGNCGGSNPAVKIIGTATPDVFIGGDAPYRLRELYMGNYLADGIFMTQRLAALNTFAGSGLFTSANTGGAYPFDNDGSFILKSRSQVGSGVSVCTGAAATERLRIDGVGHTNLLAGDLGLCQSATSPQILDNATIATSLLIVTRINPQANRTGIILESGTQPGQMCVVINENSTFTATFAVAGTSHVADGVASVVPALRAVKFHWDSATSLWYRA